MDEYADVLREWVAEVEAKYEELGDPGAVEDHFAEKAEMADVWGERKASEEARLNVRGVVTYLDRRGE
jgi:hypothetical protein